MDRNLGEGPLLFRQGGHQRGPRDDQFRFFGSGPQGTLPVKEATNFGALMHVVTIPPNEEVLLRVELNAWFDLETPGSYFLFGSYLLPICKSETVAFPTDWEDYLVRPFSFEVTGKR